jgi:hypothetical protein
MRTRAILAVLMAVLMSAPLWTQNALACGGFFCSNSNPVDQVGERILFSVEGTTVTAHIQIQYKGPANFFSWIIPVPGVPDVSVGTDTVFTRLRQLTDPRFELQWQKSEVCSPVNDCWDEGGSSDGDSGGSDGGDTGGEEPQVNVLSEGEAGPYNYKVLEADTGQVLFEWLNENGYDQPEEAQELIEHYVNLSFKFVALKLLKNKQAGEIQPLVVRYSAPNLACIPIKLTSIAAQPNMPVWTWVLAKSRAIPINFFHVLLNPKAYDWIKCAIQTGEFFGWSEGGGNCTKEYMDLVTKAVDTANGHAFVTEYAGTTSGMKDKIYKEGQFAYLAAAKSKKSAPEFLDHLFSKGFPNSPMFQQLIFMHIPKPDGLPENCDEDNEFYNWNMEECIKLMPEGWVFDPVAFVEDIEERIVKPLKDAQTMFDIYPYMTRLFTTLSPDEMSKDPVFSFNPDLPDVSNVHVSKATPVCKEGSTSEVIGANIEYVNGDIAFVEGTWKWCNFEVGDGGGSTGGDGGDVSPASEIQVLSESGPPKKVAKEDLDATEAEMDLLTPDPDASGKEQDPDANADGTADGTFGTPVDDGDGTGDGTEAGSEAGSGSTSGSGSGGSSSGCSTGLGPAGAMGWMLLMVMLGFYAVLREERE